MELIRHILIIWLIWVLLCFGFSKAYACSGSAPILPEAPLLTAIRHDEISSIEPIVGYPGKTVSLFESEFILDHDGDETVLHHQAGMKLEDLKGLESLSLTHRGLEEFQIQSVYMVYQTLFTHKYSLEFKQDKNELQIEMDPKLFETDLLKIFKLRITLKDIGKSKIHLVIPVRF